MSANPYEQIVADLKARRSQLDTDIALAEQLRDRWGGGGVASTTDSAPASQAANIAPNAFFRMSIADAAVKLLGMVQRRLSTNEIIDMLEHGGLPRSKYNTVYAILMRRQNDVEDIEKHGSQWGLSEWTGRRRKKPISLNPKDFESEEEALQLEESGSSNAEEITKGA